MRLFFAGVLCFAFLAALLLSGCSQSASVASVQDDSMVGKNVELAADIVRVQYALMKIGSHCEGSGCFEGYVLGDSSNPDAGEVLAYFADSERKSHFEGGLLPAGSKVVVRGVVEKNGERFQILVSSIRKVS